MRVLDLPVEVDSSKVSATLKDGILKIEMPKAAHAKAVRFEAKTAWERRIGTGRARTAFRARHPRK